MIYRSSARNPESYYVEVNIFFCLNKNDFVTVAIHELSQTSPLCNVVFVIDLYVEVIMQNHVFENLESTHNLTVLEVP